MVRRGQDTQEVVLSEDEDGYQLPKRTKHSEWVARGGEGFVHSGRVC